MYECHFFQCYFPDNFENFQLKSSNVLHISKTKHDAVPGRTHCASITGNCERTIISPIANFSRYFIHLLNCVKKKQMRERGTTKYAFYRVRGVVRGGSNSA